MIKQDYLLRMIEEIISLISVAIMNKKKFTQNEWCEYDSIARQIIGFDTKELTNYDMHDIIEIYKDNDDNEKNRKIELIAMIMLKMSEETENNIVVKSRLKQNGTALLKYADMNDSTISLQRKFIINLLDNNI